MKPRDWKKKPTSLTPPMESIRIQWIHWTSSKRFQPSRTTWWPYPKSLANKKIKIFDGIYSCPMDPMNSIGTNFNPHVTHKNIPKSHTNRGLTPSRKSILSKRTPTSGKLFTTRLPVFQWIAKGHEWNLFDIIGQPSIFPISFKIEKWSYSTNHCSR